MKALALYLRISLALVICCLGYQVHAAGVICDPDPGTDMVVQYGDTILCTMEYRNDSDSFHFLASAGDDVNLTVGGATGEGRYEMYLYAPSGALIDKNGGAVSVSARINEALSEDGMHTVVVRNAGVELGHDYALTIPCIAGRCVSAPPSEGLSYHAVAPCRIVDTRYGIGGAMSSGEIRHFHSYGDVTDQNQAAGGVPAGFDYPEDCPFALGEHDAVLMNLTVVPVGAGGFATMWAWNQPRPAASFVNFIATGGPIANAGVVKTASDSKLNPDFSIYASSSMHLVIDVLGYFTD